MKRIIIIASILVVLIIAACLVYFSTTKNDNTVITETNTDLDDVEDISVKQTLEEADKSVSNEIANDTDIIVFDSVDYSGISDNVTENIFDFTGTEERNLIYTLVDSWATKLGFNPSDVEYVSDNFGQGYEEIIIRVKCNNNLAEIHYTYNDNGIEGYLKDITDKE